MKANNKQNYWFKRRRYGYGWVPVTWQGWTTVIIFFAVILGSTAILKDAPRNEFSAEVGMYIAIVLVDIAVLFLISYMKGPAPKWRWGKSDEDDESEDF